MVEVHLECVSKKFGDTVAVDSVSLQVAAGELFFLLGPSGCGKTTCLRMIAGFYLPDTGRIYFGRREVTHLAPHLRNTGMVFQNYALFPHMNVAKNVEYGLRLRGLSPAERGKKVAHVLDIVRMPDAGRKLPNQLSGGQQQRIALARALVIEPDVLLLDEPLSNLDAKLRMEMRDEIRRIHHDTGVTAIYVTHDQKEALSIADRLAVMHNGCIEQIGTPHDVYNFPANVFVAGFIGETNFFPCEVASCSAKAMRLQSRWGVIVSTRPHKTLSASRAVTACVRPEKVSIESSSRGGSPVDVNCLSAKVKAVTYFGDQQQYLLALADGLETKATTLAPTGEIVHKVGDDVTMCFLPEDVSVFDSATGMAV